MTMTRPIHATKRRPFVPPPRRLPSGGRKQLVIEASAPMERWDELFQAIEDLARLGETIDCSLPPLECQYSSTPLRTDEPERRDLPTEEPLAPSHP